MHHSLTIDIDLYGESFRLLAELGRYENDRLAISFVTHDGEPFGHLTINMPQADLPDGMVFVKDWSENAGWVPQIIAAGWLVPDNSGVMSGMVVVPRMKLAGALAEYVTAMEGAI